MGVAGPVLGEGVWPSSCSFVELLRMRKWERDILDFTEFERWAGEPSPPASCALFPGGDVIAERGSLLEELRDCCETVL